MNKDPHWGHIQVTEEPRQTSEELQASLVSVKVNAHDSKIRWTSCKKWHHGGVARCKPPSLVSHSLQERLDDPPGLLGWYSANWWSGKKLTCHSVIRTSNQVEQKIREENVCSSVCGLMLQCSRMRIQRTQVHIWTARDKYNECFWKTLQRSWI